MRVAFASSQSVVQLVGCVRLGRGRGGHDLGGTSAQPENDSSVSHRIGLLVRPALEVGAELVLPVGHGRHQLVPDRVGVRVVAELQGVGQGRGLLDGRLLGEDLHVEDSRAVRLGAGLVALQSGNGVHLDRDPVELGGSSIPALLVTAFEGHEVPV